LREKGNSYAMNLSVINKIKEIKNDRIHGANWLSRKTLKILKYGIEKTEVKDKKEFLKEIRGLGKRLVEAKPTMTPILNNVSEVIYKLSEESEMRDLSSLRRWGISKIDELLKRSNLAFKNCIRYGAEIIEENDKIMTCSYSSTICEVFKISKGKKVNVKIAQSKFLSADRQDKSQNYGEITSKILKDYGISNEIIPDKDIEKYISKVKKVLVGADTILRDGSLINGTPTQKIALAAKERVPFYVICERAKFNINKKIRLEEGFDLTPPESITEIVTEFGRIKPEEVARVDTLKTLCYNEFKVEVRL
jgi:translation initiation factor eIF-2B subunit delta